MKTIYFRTPVYIALENGQKGVIELFQIKSLKKKKLKGFMKPVSRHANGANIKN